jgi:thiol-disulfide isomerase/thioredoxin
MRGAMLRMLLVAMLLAALPACSPEAPDGQPAEAQASGAGVDRSHKGKLAPPTPFQNSDGKEVSLATFKGRPLLVNLWATWCAPCVKELPTLDRLARGAGANGLQVLAISQDSGPRQSVIAFLKSIGIARLAPYQDPRMAMSGALGAEVLPTSILYDAEGRELWRYVGDLDWTGAEGAKLVAEAEAR